MAVFRRGRATNSPSGAADAPRDAEIVTGNIPGPERSGLTPVAEWPEALASLQGTRRGDARSHRAGLAALRRRLPLLP